MPPPRALVVVPDGRPHLASDEAFWAPVRWAVLWAVPREAFVEIVVVRRRGTRFRALQHDLLAVLDAVRAELPDCPLSLSVRGPRELPQLVARTRAEDILVLAGDGPGAGRLARRLLPKALGEAVRVAGGGVPSGSRQDPAASVPEPVVVPTVEARELH